VPSGPGADNRPDRPEIRPEYPPFGEDPMINHNVRVYRSEENLPRQDQLAWKMAEVATDPVAVEPAVEEMIINRIIDNASVALASLNRGPIISARAQALTHGPTPGGQGSG